MVYRATQDVVRRVMPLLDRLATRSVDKARLLQYFSARAGQAWGVLDLVGDTRPEAALSNGVVATAPERTLTFRDRISGGEHVIPYPSCLDDLPPALETLLCAEYKRLAMDRPLSAMDPMLFDHFYATSHCAHCRWRGPDYSQFHRECHFAGHPVNFEAE